MKWADVLFSPRGTLKPQHFAIIVTAIYVLNIVAGSVLDGQFIKRVGPWPYLALQVILTWIWFTAHAKRLRDAGRGYVVAAVLAFIYLGTIVVMLNLVAYSTANISGAVDPTTEPKVSLFGVIFAVLFINTLFTGDIFLISALLFVFIGLPLLFALMVLIYSVVTGMRASLMAETPAVLPAAIPPTPPTPTPPAPAPKPRSPFS
jgi:hypothetical protein